MTDYLENKDRIVKLGYFLLFLDVVRVVTGSSTHEFTVYTGFVDRIRATINP